MKKTFSTKKMVAILLLAVGIFSLASGIFFLVVSSTFSPFFPWLNSLLDADISPEKLSEALDFVAEKNQTLEGLATVKSTDDFLHCVLDNENSPLDLLVGLDSILGGERFGKLLFSLLSCQPNTKNPGAFAALSYASSLQAESRQANFAELSETIDKFEKPSGHEQLDFSTFTQRQWIATASTLFSVADFLNGIEKQKLAEIVEIFKKMVAATDFFAEISIKDMLKAANFSGELFGSCISENWTELVLFSRQLVPEEYFQGFDIASNVGGVVAWAADTLANFDTVTLSTIVEQLPFFEEAFASACFVFVESDFFSHNRQALSDELDFLFCELAKIFKKQNPFVEKGQAVFFLEHCAWLSKSNLDDNSRQQIAEFFVFFGF